MNKITKVLISFEKDIDPNDLIKYISHLEDAHMIKESSKEYMFYISNESLESFYLKVFDTYGQYTKKELNL